MTADLSALIARLEAGPVYLTHKEAYDLAIFFGSDTALGMSSMIRKAFVGGSLDAALALAERVLEERVWFVRKETDGSHAGIFVPLKLDVHQGVAKTPALALCIATLRAKQGEGE